MRLEERRIVKVVVVLGALGAIGAVAFPFAIYFFGLALAPPQGSPDAEGEHKERTREPYHRAPARLAKSCQ